MGFELKPLRQNTSWRHRISVSDLLKKGGFYEEYLYYVCIHRHLSNTDFCLLQQYCGCTDYCILLE